MRTLVIALALSAAACTQTGSVRVQLTDAPLDAAGVTQVLISVGEVRVHNSEDKSVDKNGNPDANAGSDGATGTGWIVLCNNSPAKVYDLMALRNDVRADLCGAKATEMVLGKITQIRLGVTAASVVTAGGTYDMKVPSGPQSGLKIPVNRDLHRNETMTLVLDLDAEKSVVDHGNGTYSFKPVLSLK